MSDKKFPSGFVWGTATSSHQIEGAAYEDGRSESIWDRFSSIPGNVQDGDTGEVACDHYHLFKEDVALMKELGMKAYRFSISWSRVLPEGTGDVNEPGVKFYSDLVDALLKAGIEPYATLYHWDLPQALQDIGGWTNDKMPDYFLEFSRLMFDRLGDRVKNWMTLNEPYCASFLGYYEGRMAPGMHDFSAAVRAAYHMYVGHGLAVKYFREHNRAGKIGIALNLMGRLPLTDSEEDKLASRHADGYLNRWFIEPIVKGEYPSDMIEFYKSQGVVLPEFKKADLKLISQELDFIGLNYYNDFWVKATNDNWPLNFKIENPKGVPLTHCGWPITEDGFYNMLMRLKNEYGVKNILITENGTAFIDTVGLNGRVEDGARTDFLKRHILALHRAIEDGAPVTGYFVWSLYDNFEWASGYSRRFGIVYVDYTTQKRIVKDSGHWYGELIAKNAVE